MSEGWDFGALGCPRLKGGFFFEHDIVAYQIDGDEQNAEQNASNIFTRPRVKPSDLGVRLKGQILLNSSCKVNFKYLIPNLVCVLTNKT